jgi:hypothetical protein
MSLPHQQEGSTSLPLKLRLALWPVWTDRCGGNQAMLLWGLGHDRSAVLLWLLGKLALGVGCQEKVSELAI